ncbi:DUF2612 domain-containing protein [Neisseria sp. Dent CA1/247]|uniref:DUF2612 domain-containing protein n=1 Tax=Neisseria sp. Dent CA1/247 TaxID=2912675 RepID=UPI001FD41EAB|nr:DUF2612 domain-containing protein [Neisseria sp. Dent CA1/247]UOO77915.1 DUF2612 domain-containing protein [Neisseria sp. Dent CA1/247]
MINVKDTVISQYAHSPIMLEIIKDMNKSIDPRHDIKAFYDDVWNIATAKGYGLDVWGAIVGINRRVKVTAEDVNIGFAEGFTPFNDGVWSIGANGSNIYRLDDEAYRNIIMIKAAGNIIYATAYHINKLLTKLFENRGRAYFVKSGTMAARYVFEFYLNPIERSIIRQSDILPRPSGVLLDFYEPQPSDYFGFTEANLAPFGQGVFYLEN